jgi:two-component sensor histidine kinase
MLSMSRRAANQNGSSSEVVALLGDVHRQLSDLLREMPTNAAPELARLGLIDALRQTVEDELANAFDDVTWEVQPEAEHQAQAIPPLTVEVLFYAAREAVRNAARYGRGGDGTRPLCLRVGIVWHDPSTGSGHGPSTGSLASAPQVQAGRDPLTGSLASAPQVQAGRGLSTGSLVSAPQAQAGQSPSTSWLGELEIVIEDDGVGLKSEEEVGGGGGQGLALHSTMMAVVGGALAVESVPDTFTRVSLTLPQGTRQSRSLA